MPKKGNIPWNKGKIIGYSKEYVGGYSAIHKWLNSHYGKANKCDGLTCSKESNMFYWALIKGKDYQYNRENFMMLCASCHKSYDYTEAQRLEASNRMKANQRINGRWT